MSYNFFAAKLREKINYFIRVFLLLSYLLRMISDVFDKVLRVKILLKLMVGIFLQSNSKEYRKTRKFFHTAIYNFKERQEIRITLFLL